MTKFSVRAMMVPAALAAAFGGGVIASSASADQPYMQSALGQLQAARATLAGAQDNKGGHRLRAIAAVDRAIVEVRAGIAYAR